MEMILTRISAGDSVAMVTRGEDDKEKRAVSTGQQEKGDIFFIVSLATECVVCSAKYMRCDATV